MTLGPRDTDPAVVCPASAEALEEIQLLVKARQPLLVVETWEEDRLEETLKEAAEKLHVPYHVWSITGGLRIEGGAHELYDTKAPLRALDNLPSMGDEGIWLFKDLQHFLSRADVVRRLLDLCRLRPEQHRTLVLSGPVIDLPAELAKVGMPVRLSPPTDAELRMLVARVVRDLARRQRVRVDLSDDDTRRLVSGLKGLTYDEAARAVARVVLDDGALTGADVATVQAIKRSSLEAGGVVSYVPPDPRGVEVGGFDAFKRWLSKRVKAFSPEAEAFGLTPPKGVVLLGVQGCGKTLAARLVAATWGLPLLKLEPGRLYDKFIGESEKRLDGALDTSETLAPCVLLIDEVEKGFAATGGSDVDGGLSRRIFGRLLGWLQERRSAVFVVATSNDVAALPPELLRKGRFDEVFFVDLPDEEERREIFSLHLRRRDRDPAAFDLPRLAKVAQGFSGAEIEQAIVSALYTVFAAGQRLDTDAIAAEISATRPLSVLRAEDVARLRAWAAGRAVPAR